MMDVNGVLVEWNSFENKYEVYQPDAETIRALIEDAALAEAYYLETIAREAEEDRQEREMAAADSLVADQEVFYYNLPYQPNILQLAEGW